MASPTSLLFILLLAIASADGQPEAPPPTSPISLTDILVRQRKYGTLLGFLNATGVGTQLTDLINRPSTGGFTLFAPTDDAFKNTSPGILRNLLPEQEVDLLRYHVLPHFYTRQNFRNITNPVMTLASRNASGGAGYTLNFTVNSGQEEVNISTGVVETQFHTELYLQSPVLVVYEVDKVLLPPAIFPTSLPPQSPVDSSPAPNGPRHAGAGSSPAPNGPRHAGAGSSPAPNGPRHAGAGKMEYSEVVLGLVLACALLV